MKISISVVILVILGIVAALAAAMFTATLSAGRFGNVLNAEAPDITILTTSGDIQMMTPIRAEDIVEKAVKAGDAPSNYFTDPTQIIGRRIIIEMYAGQAYSAAAFPREGSGAHLAAQIPPGKRAVNIQISGYESLQGLLYPGAVVDVLASFRVSGNRSEGNALATTLLQNIQVLAVANSIVGDNSSIEESTSGMKNKVSSQPSVTLLVTTKQAEALQLAMKHGQISLTLRNPSDEEPVNDEATLLSEGVMARLATLLGTSVSDDIAPMKKKVEPLPVVEEPEEVVIEAPKPPPARVTKKKIIRVNVFNGLKVTEESKEESGN